ncbi:hypothetical protein CANCADRAFT_4385 [Tortispora caseinolytica NRRL Y-17796]|uniref:20S-pre-rRNA D-site endonuclease NOB1 n=1 Tax=Tortispora caseinolytica NRRL Y-17796 TaxID=767744 RepID=A0A1E4TDC2_9ASCO|nr:hypothetical protein CANCADRAFT_4385 [Tortispora caseinolytica NRRL Y-17796]
MNASCEALVLDAAPLINEPVAVLEKRASLFYTTPSVFAEIRDAEARRKLDLWGDKLTVRQPSKTSREAVELASKESGDYSVLSAADIGLIALCYEITCEKNDGNVPKITFSKTPKVKQAIDDQAEKDTESADQTEKLDVSTLEIDDSTLATDDFTSATDNNESNLSESDGWSTVQTKGRKSSNRKPRSAPDSDRWITPDNIASIHEDDSEIVETTAADYVRVCLSTGDFAVQNVAMRMHLQLMNIGTGKLIRTIRSYRLRCHACFKLVPPSNNTKNQKFCPSCGGATLTRVTVSTSAETGELQVHLKANFQWSNRGNKYSMPNPLSVKSRKKGTITNDIYVRADQKEYLKAVKDHDWQERHHQKQLEEWFGDAGSAVDVGNTPFAINSSSRSSNSAGVRVGLGRHANRPNPHKN